MPCYARRMTTAKREDQEISRDKEYQPERRTDRCRCVSLYTPECSETQEYGRLLEAAQHFFAASILAHSNLASWDTDAAVEACH
ncbi:hypothetical protein B0H65DRAFT_413707 [Neurospora tetraspora]|uniref:Uncharacterized protein n=1 Tax=Neurospora tetraspora TaxID=94610 RepID=A0AAE0JMV2_9PEZI|nr:hypothetical protein B0H65DRAFT_413707 [Neurospora tetraspora]